MTKRRSIATIIDVLEVRDKAGNFTLSSLQSILEILRRTQNISCVTLQFSFTPSLRLPMDDQVFQNLTSLNVNIPHAALTRSLINHPAITDLVLGVCGSPTCPLINSTLHSLRNLTCPPGCVQGLISAGTYLTRLVSFHGSPEDASFLMTRLLDFQVIPTFSVLTVLDIDFHHTTTRLLQRISAAAPAVAVLRLTESHFIVEVCHSVCDTDDHLIK